MSLRSDDSTRRRTWANRKHCHCAPFQLRCLGPVVENRVRVDFPPSHQRAILARPLGEINSDPNSFMEARLRERGRLVYAGAGTSGRLAVQDGAELMPTFSWPEERLLLLMAGGNKALLQSVEGAEDEVEHAVRLVRQHNINADDVLIAVAASGTTPFTLACMREAKARGALTIGIANNRGTPILEEAEHPVWLDTGSEPIAGSTRMKAGTA